MDEQGERRRRLEAALVPRRVRVRSVIVWSRRARFAAWRSGEVDRIRAEARRRARASRPDGPDDARS